MTERVEPAATSGILRRNTAFATLSAGSAVLLLIVRALVAPVLGRGGVRPFQWVLTLAMIGEALMDMGVHQITIRSIARDRSQAARLFHNSLALKAVTGTAMFCAMGAISYALSRDLALWHASLVMLGVAVLRSYFLTIRGVLQGLERFGNDCLVVVGDRVLVLVAVWLAVRAGGGIAGVATAFLVRHTAARRGRRGAGARASPGRRRPTQLRRRVVARAPARQALPIGMFLVVLNFYSYVDTLMLGVISTFGDTGLYGNAYRIYEGLSYAPAILSAVLTPRLSSLWSADRRGHHRLARQALAAALGLAIALAIPVWIFAQPILVLVFGPAAAEAVLALRLLLAGLGFVFVIWILHAVALSVFQERLLFSTTLIGAVVNASLNLFLIPRYGRNGAALATVLGEFLTLVLLLWGLRRALRGTTETV